MFAVTDEKTNVDSTRKEMKSLSYKKIKNNPNAVFVKTVDRIANIVHSMNQNNVKKLKMYIGEHEDFQEIFEKYDANGLKERLDKLIILAKEQL